MKEVRDDEADIRAAMSKKGVKISNNLSIYHYQKYEHDKPKLKFLY